MRSIVPPSGLIWGMSRSERKTSGAACGRMNSCSGSFLRPKNPAMPPRRTGASGVGMILVSPDVESMVTCAEAWSGRQTITTAKSPRGRKNSRFMRVRNDSVLSRSAVRLFFFFFFFTVPSSCRRENSLETSLGLFGIMQSDRNGRRHDKCRHVRHEANTECGKVNCIETSRRLKRDGQLVPLLTPTEWPIHYLTGRVELRQEP